MAKRVTMKDVALKVGVTQATVSMVLSNNKSIPEKTRRKVLEAVKELNYYPNLAARSLVKGKTDTIAVVSEFYYSAFFQQMLDGIEHEIAKSHYSIIQFSSLRKPERLTEIYKQIIYGRMADAVISFGIVPDLSLIDEFIRLEIPLVILEDTAPGVHSVTCDNYKGGYLVGKHFIRTGRTNVLCAHVPIRLSTDQNLVQQDRVNGFLQAFIDNGTPVPADNIIDLNHYYLAEGDVLYNRIKDKVGNCDGLFSAAGDSVAIGLCHALQNSGVNIPEDFAVIGFDDLQIASFLSPGLTTIRQPGVQMGTQAARIAVEALDKASKNAGENIVYEPELILRGTA